MLQNHVEWYKDVYNRINTTRKQKHPRFGSPDLLTNTSVNGARYAILHLDVQFRNSEFAVN